MNNTEYKDWEKEFSFLATMPKNNPFSLPENYFENSKEEMLSQSIILNYHKKTTEGFVVPEKFFTNEFDAILRKVNQIENPEKIGGFSIPEGYFNDLSNVINSRIETEDSPKKKILKIWTSDFLKYATAACFILITATALYFNNKDYEFINTQESAYFSDNDLYYIDEQTIIDHVDFLNESNISQNVSSAEAEDYIINNYSTTELMNEYR